MLTVRTDSSAWATQLRMMAPQLVAMLNEQLGDGTVTRVKVLGPDAPSWKQGRLSVRDGRGPATLTGSRGRVPGALATGTPAGGWGVPPHGRGAESTVSELPRA